MDDEASRIDDEGRELAKLLKVHAAEDPAGVQLAVKLIDYAFRGIDLKVAEQILERGVFHAGTALAVLHIARDVFSGVDRGFVDRLIPKNTEMALRASARAASGLELWACFEECHKSQQERGL